MRDFTSSEGPQLFIHQFTHAYVDFRDLRDAYADYFRNSVLASLAQRQFCINLRNEFPSWGERLWGLTASDSADGYKAWGGPPRTRTLMRWTARSCLARPQARSRSCPVKR